jgi:hypothetical protein
MFIRIFLFFIKIAKVTFRLSARVNGVAFYNAQVYKTFKHYHIDYLRDSNKLL